MEPRLSLREHAARESLMRMIIPQISYTCRACGAQTVPGHRWSMGGGVLCDACHSKAQPPKPR